MTDPATGQQEARINLTKRLARFWFVATLVLWGVSAVVAFAWWDAQVNDLAGGPRGGFAAGGMFPWYFVAPGALLGVWTLAKAVAAGRRHARLRRQAP